jgi:hypothetical protein
MPPIGIETGQIAGLDFGCPRGRKFAEMPHRYRVVPIPPQRPVGGAGRSEATFVHSCLIPVARTPRLILVIALLTGAITFTKMWISKPAIGDRSTTCGASTCHTFG